MVSPLLLNPRYARGTCRRHRWAITVVNDWDGVTILKCCRRCPAEEVVKDPKAVRHEMGLSRRRYLYRQRRD